MGFNLLIILLLFLEFDFFCQELMIWTALGRFFTPGEAQNSEAGVRSGVPRGRWSSALRNGMVLAPLVLLHVMPGKNMETQ